MKRGWRTLALALALSSMALRAELATTCCLKCPAFMTPAPACSMPADSAHLRQVLCQETGVWAGGFGASADTM